MPSRRDLYRLGAVALGGLMSLGLAVPGLAYLLDPLWKKRAAKGGFTPVGKLDDLPVGIPTAKPIIAGRSDAWVKYPEEAIGSVWLIRQPEGSKDKVLAFSAECPHLGCGVNLSADGQSFNCPCHTSAFALDGSPKNNVPPRGLDRLDVEVDSSEVRVRFQRFRSQSERQVPLA